METSDDIATELSPLEQRRAELRALSDEIMAVIKTLSKPTTWLEGDRAMRCLATSDRTMVQLFSKVRAHSPSSRASAPSAPRDPVPEPAFVYRYDDDGVDDIVDSDEDSAGQALDTALDDMEALLDALDSGVIPASKTTLKSLPAAKPAKPGSHGGYHQLAHTLTRGRDLLLELAANPLPAPP